MCQILVHKNNHILKLIINVLYDSDNDKQNIIIKMTIKIAIDIGGVIYNDDDESLSKRAFM